MITLYFIQRVSLSSCFDSDIDISVDHVWNMRANILSECVWDKLAVKERCIKDELLRNSCLRGLDFRYGNLFQTDNENTFSL